MPISTTGLACGNWCEKISSGFTNGIEPDIKEFYNHFPELSNPCNKPDFNIGYENSKIQFLAKYDARICISAVGDGVVSEIINQYFTEDEITECVNQLNITNHPELKVSRLNSTRSVKVPLYHT